MKKNEKRIDGQPLEVSKILEGIESMDAEQPILLGEEGKQYLLMVSEFADDAVKEKLALLRNVQIQYVSAKDIPDTRVCYFWEVNDELKQMFEDSKVAMSAGPSTAINHGNDPRAAKGPSRKQRRDWKFGRGEFAHMRAPNTKKKRK
jgi:hypothetical protein